MKQNHWPLTFQTKVKSNTLTVISFIFFEDGTKLEIPFEIKPPLIVTGNKFNHANDPQTSRKIVYVYFYCVHETQLMRESCMTFSLCINSHVNKINTSQSELLFFVAYWAYCIFSSFSSPFCIATMHIFNFSSRPAPIKV